MKGNTVCTLMGLETSIYINCHASKYSKGRRISQEFSHVCKIVQNSCNIVPS